MKHVSTTLLIVMVSMASCAINQNKETVKESTPALVVPETLKDDWTEWIVGEWEFFYELGEMESRSKIVMNAKLGLNDQFLIIKYESEITDEAIEELKKSMETSNQEAEKFKSMNHIEVEFFTIDQETGQIIGNLFDSLRCIAQGRGRRQENKEIIEWKWNCSGFEATSVRTIERINDDKLIMTDKFVAPDGSVWMEGKAEAIRKKAITEK
ncbi:MAG: hypothetical protein ACYSWZ_22585 [Planctomycetota bacterium]